jgi:hypothetical protein
MIDQHAARVVVANRYTAEIIIAPDFPQPGDYVIAGPQRNNLNGEQGWHLYLGCVVNTSGDARYDHAGWVEVKHPDGIIRKHSGQFFYRATGALAGRIRNLFVSKPTPLRPGSWRDD